MELFDCQNKKIGMGKKCLRESKKHRIKIYYITGCSIAGYSNNFYTKLSKRFISQKND